MIDSEQRLEQLVERAGTLYSLPAVAMQVLELTAQPEIDTLALKQCLENDPALTSKILKVVNSSLFGLSSKVTSLNQAIALLGIKPLKLLVLGFSLPERLFDNVRSEVLASYWRHTLTKAVAARDLSERYFHQPGDEAFIAGLLSDLGLLVLLQDLGDPYAEFVHRVVQGGGNLLTMEAEALGFDHTALSTRLLARWGLPRTIVDAVGAVKQVNILKRRSLDGNSLSRVLHLAELVAQLVADHRLNALPELLEAGRVYCHLTRDQVKQLIAALGGKVAALAEVLSLELPEGLKRQDVLEQAQARLSEVAADMAAYLVRAEQDDLALAHDLWAETRELASAASQLARHLPVSNKARPRAVPGAPHHVNHDRTSAPRAAAPTVRRVPLHAATFVEFEPALVDQLSLVAIECRQARCELSLLLVEIEEGVGFDHEPQLTRLIGAAVQRLEHPEASLLRIRAACYAVVLPDCDRPLAVELANQLLKLLPDLARLPACGMTLRTISIGATTVAVPPRNFPAQNLLISAERCLHAAQASGGNTVKSIEIY